MSDLMIAMQIEAAIVEAIANRQDYVAIHFGGDDSPDMVYMPGCGWYSF